MGTGTSIAGDRAPSTAYERQVEKTLIVKPTGPQNNSWLESSVVHVTTGALSGTMILSQGSGNQIIDSINLSIPGMIGNPYVAVRFFDGLVSADLPFTGSLFVNSQPQAGFNLNNQTLTTGSLGYQFSGRSTDGASGAFIYVNYGY